MGCGIIELEKNMLQMAIKSFEYKFKKMISKVKLQLKHLSIFELKSQISLEDL